MIGLAVLLATPLASAVTISSREGPYGVSSSVMKLIDNTRRDPFAEQSESRRHIMLSSFFPSGPQEECQSYSAPYMPPRTAAVYDAMYGSYGLPNGTFGSLEMSHCHFNKSMTSTKPGTYPLVLFSPGLSNSRLIYNAMAQSLSSQGFVVITVDHPYDASIVEYPDGSFALAAEIESTEQITHDLAVRQADISFVISQLRNQSNRQELFRDLVAVENLDHVLVYGHSLGGATAAAAMLEDCRVTGGMNLDGTLFGPVIEQGLECPFMILGHEGKNLTSDASWKSIWPHLRSTKLDLMIDGAQHGSFTDLPLLAKALGFVSDELTALLGTIDAQRASEIITAYTVSFFNFARGSVDSPLIKKTTPRFPEVQLYAGSQRGRCV